MRRWDRLAERYVEEYEARGFTPERIQSVRRELDRWGSWLKHRRPKPALESVCSEHVVRYLGERTAFRSKVTVANIMGILRGMGSFLVREGIWSDNPLRWMRGPKLDWRSRVPRRIDREAMRKLWQGVATHRQGYHRWLWLSVLGMLYGTGLRRGELVRLNLEDWCREEGVVVIDGRKTGRQRRVPIPEMTWRCVEAYLPHRQNHLEALGIRDESALLVSQRGSRLSGHAMSGGIQRLAKRCGIEKVTLHQFRHTCASDLLAEGLRVLEVQEILGHQRIETTVRYVHLTDPELHEAVNRHPVNIFLQTGEAS